MFLGNESVLRRDNQERYPILPMRRYFDQVFSHPGTDLIQQRPYTALLLVVHLEVLEGKSCWRC